MHSKYVGIAVALATLAAFACTADPSPTGDGSEQEEDVDAEAIPGPDNGDPAPLEDDLAPIKPLADGGPAPTWTQIYTRYFGPGSLGHCSDANCHLKEGDRFMCGTTKEQCYQGLLLRDLLDLKTPAKSRLVNRLRSPLAWYGGAGKMPPDAIKVNQTAADEIDAWVHAGAKNN
jgi:hypothetical protein